MLLSEELVRKFQTLHLEKFNIKIEYATAELQLKELAELVRITHDGERA
jgi:hypothetical protein